MLHVLSSTASKLRQDQSKNRIEHIESFRPGVTFSGTHDNVLLVWLQLWYQMDVSWFAWCAGCPTCVSVGLSSWLPAIFGLKAVCHRYNALLNVLDPVVLEFGHRWPAARSGIHIRCCRGPGRSQSADGLDIFEKSDRWRCHVVHSPKIWPKDWKFLWSMNLGMIPQENRQFKSLKCSSRLG